MILLSEALTSEKKLTHLEHNEDHALHSGAAGTQHAIDNLNAVYDKLNGKKNDADVQVKHDGSVSVVAGYHPENGKFFIGTKGTFNKTPKINYTSEDIEKNHGHAPGLVSKLKQVMEHLPKVIPKGKIFQGDVMYTKDDVVDKGGKYHFKPNVISYSTDKDSDEGKKIAKAKLGILLHTGYEGKTFDGMEANYTPDKSELKQHPDVHLLSNAHDFSKTPMDETEKASYEGHINAAKELQKDVSTTDYNKLTTHSGHLQTYVNRTVREANVPSIEGYKSHLKDHFNKQMSGLKTEKAKGARKDELNKHLSDVQDSQQSFEKGLRLHHHLQEAKNVLIGSLAKHQTYQHHFDDNEETKPEGYVVVRNNRPSKFVDRTPEGFARKNLTSGRF